MKTFDVTRNEFIAECSHSVGEGKLKGLFKWDRYVIFEEFFSLANVVCLSHSAYAVTNTDLPTPGKGKSGDPLKKSGDSSKKNIEILLIKLIKPLFHRGN